MKLNKIKGKSVGSRMETGDTGGVGVSDFKTVLHGSAGK